MTSPCGEAPPTAQSWRSGHSSSATHWSVERHGATVIPGYEWPVDQQMATIPVVGVALGPCAGFAAVKVAMSHFSVMVKGTSQVFAAGPAVVAAGLGETLTKDQLGGSSI